MLVTVRFPNGESTKFGFSGGNSKIIDLKKSIVDFRESPFYGYRREITIRKTGGQRMKPFDLLSDSQVYYAIKQLYSSLDSLRSKGRVFDPVAIPGE